LRSAGATCRGAADKAGITEHTARIVGRIICPSPTVIKSGAARLIEAEHNIPVRGVDDKFEATARSIDAPGGHGDLGKRGVTYAAMGGPG
jgi:hypothetical protein